MYDAARVPRSRTGTLFDTGAKRVSARAHGDASAVALVKNVLEQVIVQKALAQQGIYAQQLDHLEADVAKVAPSEPYKLSGPSR
jgi:hypothetical protein